MLKIKVFRSLKIERFSSIYCFKLPKLGYIFQYLTLVTVSRNFGQCSFSTNLLDAQFCNHKQPIIYTKKHFAQEPVKNSKTMVFSNAFLISFYTFNIIFLKKLKIFFL